MSLVDFCKSLPSDLVLAPIYKKGVEMPSGKIAVGKNPVPAAWDRDLDAADAARIFEKSPNVGALGIWCGIRGGGIVIVDVDRNLFQLKQKWGKSLDGAPVVTSPKENAAKFIFRISDELIWGEDLKDGQLFAALAHPSGKGGLTTGRVSDSITSCVYQG